ncbi:MAG: AraC family transcriptional regulator [Pyramidobacter sp.]|uniref:AraC family transcriptional regulator n=1 Tax=Pyramidobacter sp. TaxID=1943581 RepID=UPI002A81FF50|nr:AraC family transcriptional regulator [Pyramidobacter sp.]MDY4031726.1 AraC family transcriptional regulator [Pyramidobacter sp.]
MKYYCVGAAPHWPHPFEIYVRDVNFFRYNWHAEFEFTLILRGGINLSTSGITHTLHGGDVFLINANRGHAWVSSERDSAAISIHFAPEYFADLEPSFKNIEIDCVSTPQTRAEPRFTRLRQYAAQTMLAAVSASPADRFTLRGAFNMLLGTLLASFPVQRAETRDSPYAHKNMKTIQNVTDWMEKNFDKKITLDDAAKIARYNRTYFSSFFRRNVGISFHDYLTRIRFRHALYRLNNTGYSLTAIAADCGFSDLKTFSAYYKKTFSEPPSERRRSVDTSSFTPAKESERVFLDTNAPGIGEKLYNFALIKPPEPMLPVQPQSARRHDLDRIAMLCRQIMKIASGERDER